jgi:hypothetical protein
MNPLSPSGASPFQGVFVTPFFIASADLPRH